jgi:hypothetical protein
MTKPPQGPSSDGRKSPHGRKVRSPLSPEYDKKLDGPNQPST